MPWDEGRRKIQVGIGTGRMAKMGVCNTDVTPIGNVLTGEDDLISETLKANSFYANGCAIRITALGRHAANANSKTVKLYFGGTAICTTGALAANDKPWIIRAMVYRTATDVQVAFADGQANAAIIAAQRTALTIDDGAAIIVKVTGESDTATNDIICDALFIEYLPTPN